MVTSVDGEPGLATRRKQTKEHKPHTLPSALLPQVLKKSEWKEKQRLWYKLHLGAS